MESDRLIGGGAEFPLWAYAANKLRLTVDFGSRYFEVGKVEWGMVTRNGENLWVFPLAPTERGYAKSVEYFRGDAELRIRSLGCGFLFQI